MTPTKVIRRLVEVAPSIIAEHSRVSNRCVLASAVGIATLRRFNIDAEPLPVDLCLANAAAHQWLDEGSPGGAAEFARRGCYVLDTRGGAVKRPLSGRTWDRHMVILVPERECVIDLDMQQLRRREHGIEVPDAGVMKWPRGDREGLWKVHGSTLYLCARPDDRSYEDAKDWAVWPDMVARVERAIRKGK